MKLSDQALGAVMLALQNSLMNETDIVPVLDGFKFYMQDGQLFVENPPTVEIPEKYVYGAEVDESEPTIEETVQALRQMKDD